MKKCLLIAVATCLFVSANAQLNKPAPPKSQPKSVDQIIVEFCMRNTDPYQLNKKWLKDNKGKNTTVTPLAMDASCHDCHDQDQYRKDTAKIHRWMEQSSKPESDYIKTLLHMQRDWQLLGGSNSANGDAPKCFYDFSNEEFDEMVKQLAQRIYDRVVDMAQKNKKNPQYAFAGITYLLSVTRDMMLLGALNANDNSQVSLAGEWLKSCYDQFDRRLVKEYQYQLYPTYLGLVRELALTTGVENNFEDVMEWMKKMTAFMHFKLKVSFEASGHGDNGGKYHALVSGETEIQCTLKDGGCYIWEPVTGNTMDFNVTEVVFKSNQGSAIYKGPQTFSAPVELKVNMCAEDPTLKISFNSFGDPQETYVTSDGNTFQSPLLYSLAMATLGSANMNKLQSQAEQWKTKAEKFQGREADVDAAAKRLSDHKNDPNYLKTAQGKSDMAKMNEMAKSMGYDPSSIRPDPKQMKNVDNLQAYTAAVQKQAAKMKQQGYFGSEEYYKDQKEINNLKAKTDLNSITNQAGIDINMLQIEAPFRIGMKLPVDKIQKDKIKEISNSADGWEFGQFHVTLENIGH